MEPASRIDLAWIAGAEANDVAAALVLGNAKRFAGQCLFGLRLKSDDTFGSAETEAWFGPAGKFPAVVLALA